MQGMLNLFNKQEGFMGKKILRGRIIKNIIIITVALWNIYFFTNLIFFTDKFKKPYVNINSQVLCK